MRIDRLLAICGLLAVFVATQASAQVTSTNCTGYGNNVNCTSTTQPSVQQQYDQYQRNMAAFGRGLANLGAAIAQGRAASAARQALWDSAATEKAKEGAALARANYEATSAALQRFVADTILPTTPPVNAGLVLDWSLISGVESRFWQAGQEDVWRDIVRRWALTDTPSGVKVLRMDESVIVTFKGKHIANFTRTMRFDPASGIMVRITEGEPLIQTVPPIFYSTLLVGTHAFATTAAGHGFEVTVPVGTLDISMLKPAIAALPGELPGEFRIWVVDERGEVVPADVKVTGSTVVGEPTGPADGSCVGKTGRKERREAVVVSIQVGTAFEVDTLLAAAPHLEVFKGLQCRIVRH